MVATASLEPLFSGVLYTNQMNTIRTDSNTWLSLSLNHNVVPQVVLAVWCDQDA